VDVAESPVDQVAIADFDALRCQESPLSGIGLRAEGCLSLQVALTSWCGRLFEKQDQPPQPERLVAFEMLGTSRAPRLVTPDGDRHLFAIDMPMLDREDQPAGPFVLPDGATAVLDGKSLHRIEMIDERASLVRWKTTPLQGISLAHGPELDRRLSEGWLVHYGPVEAEPLRWLAELYEIRFGGQGAPAWRRIEMAGDAPPGGSWESLATRTRVLPYGPGNQVLVVQPEEARSGEMDLFGIWIADLDERRWVEVMRGARVRDGPRESTLAVHEATGIGLRLTEYPAPGAAVRLTDGRVLIGREALVVWSLEEGQQSLGVNLPPSTAAGYSLDLEESTGKVLVFGGADIWQRQPTSALWELDPTVPALRRSDLASPPPARARHRSLVSGGRLVLVGGLASLDPLTVRRDVWVIDRERGESRQLAELSTGRQDALLWLRDRELWVVGGWDWQGARVWQDSIEAVDLESGAVRTIAVVGEWPPQRWVLMTVFDGALLAVDRRGLHGETRAWRLEPEGDGGRWTEGTLCWPGAILANAIPVANAPSVLVGDCVQELVAGDRAPTTVVWAPPEPREYAAPPRPEVGEPGARPVISEAEIESQIEERTRRLAENRSRTCIRPVLRGEPLDGPATDDMVALLELQGPLRPCSELIAREGETTGDAAIRWNGWTLPLPLDDERAHPQVLPELERACAPAAEALDRAVRHEDACSPYLPGHRVFPAETSDVRITTMELRLLARAALREGRFAESAQLSLDAIRFSQDLTRGGSDFLLALASVVYSASAAQGLELLLDSPTPVPGPVLEQVERELGLLLETEPHVSSVLDGEMLMMSLPVLAVVRPELASSEIPRDPMMSLTSAEGLSPREQVGLSLEALSNLSRQLAESCPSDVLPSRCIAAVRQLARDARHPRPISGEMEIRAELRQAVERLILPAFTRYLERYAVRLFRLAALRLHAALRRRVQQTGRCPTPDELLGPEWTSLLTDPVSGEPMAVVSLEPGVLVIAPSWVPVELEAQERHNPHRVECPAGIDRRPTTSD
jgi:hypothetical protein